MMDKPFKLHALKNVMCTDNEGNFIVHNVHFIKPGNMVSNVDRGIDEVREA